MTEKFSLSPKFTSQHADKEPAWGFGELSKFTYLRTYSRTKEDGTKESFFDTVKRVVEGTYTLQLQHCKKTGLPWEAFRAQLSAQKMFQKIWDFKFSPPGRGLWMMGSPAMEKIGSAALNNCGYISTKDIKKDFGEPFAWACDMLMLGVGIGYDTKGAGTTTVRPRKGSPIFYDIPDTREGWVEAVRLLLNSFTGSNPVRFSYGKIRKAGSPIRGFGGTASGPDPLREGLEAIEGLLDSEVGEPVSSILITDIMNFIGKFVVAGNVRRSAEISIGEIDDAEFIDMKNPDKYREELLDRRWASNNSVFASPDADFSRVVENIAMNGEPGLVFLENSRHYGRLKDGWNEETSEKFDDCHGFNPCGEQSLKSHELCCVAHNTRILTSDGCPEIREVIDKEVEVWNGNEWSKTTPFLAATNKKLFRVHLSDGSYLDCTDDHRWSAKLRSERVYRPVETQDLEVGHRLESLEVQPIPGGIREPNAYTFGWFAGDGYLERTQSEYRPMAVVQQPEYAVLSKLGGKPYKEQHPPGYARPFRRVRLRQLGLKYTMGLRNKDEGLHGDLFGWDCLSICEFFAGWIDSDGCLRSNPNTDHYVLHGTEQKLRDAQILLRRVGINHASIRKESAAGTKTNLGTRNRDLWCLLIPSYECPSISVHCILKKTRRHGSRFAQNNAHQTSAKIDRARKQKVVAIEELPGIHNTYCFSEPKEHKGVFGNVLTYQCLVETYPANHDSPEEYHDTLKFAYLYAKSVTLLPTHDEKTNQVMLQNRRIGLSQSGVQQALKKFGHARYFKEFCDEAYKVVKRWDYVYSRWLGIPHSIKKTTIKPSGTVSILAGATPGVHCTHSKYYLRAVRISAGSEYLPALQRAGYRIEYDVTDVERRKKACEASGEEFKATHEQWDYAHLSITESKQETLEVYADAGGTLVVYFPVKEKFFTKSKADISMWEQLATIRELQEKWSDNSVSCTITFRSEEAKDLQSAIQFYSHSTKTLSFLPLKDHSYAQAPYQEIDQSEYESYSKNLKPIRYKKKSSEELKGAKFCDSDVCEI